LKQSFQDFEIILIDHASTDGTPAIIKRLSLDNPTKIVAVYSEKNYGPGGGRNIGIKYAKGEYICFCDSDDRFLIDHLEKIAICIQENVPHPDIIFFAFSKIEENGKLIYTRRYKNGNYALYQSITPWGKAINRNFIKNHQLEIPAGNILEDVIFHSIMVLLDPKISYSNHIGYFYVKNPLSLSNKLFRHFVNGAIELELDYLSSYKKTFAGKAEKEELLYYFALKCVCWHLLKSGANAGIFAMQEEYDKAFRLLDSYFPNWKKSRQISWFRPKYERPIVRFVVGFVRFLFSIHLSRAFFLLYSKVDLSRLWPRI
jgi:glycosyltransferase involved in cell wall biosynthesis